MFKFYLHDNSDEVLFMFVIDVTQSSDTSKLVIEHRFVTEGERGPNLYGVTYRQVGNGRILLSMP